MAADADDRFFPFGPARLDVAGVVMQCAIERRRAAPEINCVCRVARLAPLDSLRMRNDIEFRPGKCADIALAQPVPLFFVTTSQTVPGWRCEPTRFIVTSATAYIPSSGSPRAS